MSLSQETLLRFKKEIGPAVLVHVIPEDMHAVLDMALESLRLQAENLSMRRVVEAAKGIGMNWKLGAPYGLDALDEALSALDEAGK